MCMYSLCLSLFISVTSYHVVIVTDAWILWGILNLYGFYSSTLTTGKCLFCWNKVFAGYIILRELACYKLHIIVELEHHNWVSLKYMYIIGRVPCVSPCKCVCTHHHIWNIHMSLILFQDPAPKGLVTHNRKVLLK